MSNDDDHRQPAQTAFKKGHRVEVTKWTPPPTGRVTNVARGSVFVKYDNSFVEDELDPTHVRLIETGPSPDGDE